MIQSSIDKDIPVQDGSRTILRTAGLTKAYDDGFTALADITMDIHKGEFVTVIGASGAGKSTLLRCINRLIDPTGGRMEFNGREMMSLGKKELRQARRRIAMIFQHYNLVSRMSAVENVLHGRLGYKSTLAGCVGLYTEEEKRLAFSALEQMGMADFAYSRADQLSGGQKQRVGIARALVQDPLLMLCDEPIASLDPKSSRTVMERLRWVCSELEIACLVNLHQVDYALEFSDRIIGLKKGRKVFDGTPDQLTEEAIRFIYGEEPDGAFPGASERIGGVSHG